MNPENRLIVILGCTASGKGELARSLAARIGGEILSIDSMKVYRGMDIGTAKPSPAERAAIVHHLVDVADPWESFSAARFVELADEAVQAAHGRGKPIVAVGGTVLYFKSFYHGLFEGPEADAAFREQIRQRARTEGAAVLHAELQRVDPQAAERIHRNDLRRIERALEVHHLTGTPISRLQAQWEAPTIRRPDWAWTLIGLRRERESGSRRINERVRRMVETGLVEEARRLWSDPRGVSREAAQAVGYKELFDHFEGRWPLEHAIEQVKIHSRHLAKQQRTWLRRLPGVHWIDVDHGPAKVDEVVERVTAAS
jgi:tRNA dimethylallyltransferase